MELAALGLEVSVLNFILIVIISGILGIWTYLLIYMLRSFRLSPRLGDFKLLEANAGEQKEPKVSIILPARNEEKYIGRCLDTLIAQKYSNLEIVAINDNSTDRTAEIMQLYSSKDKRILYVENSPKPEGWTGKNWACFNGYRKSSGEYLFFTDADTEHSTDVLSLAMGHMLSQNLDALTAIPRLLCKDFWTKITLPSLSTFLHTRFSALRVNDPKKKTGYFFGSFFVIKRTAYESVGTHEGVKQELVEDGALGNKVKTAGFKMKMVRGEEHINAIWARDLDTLWHGLRRLVIPLYHQEHKGAYLIVAAIFFMMFAPFLLLGYAIPILALSFVGLAGLSAFVLFYVNIAALLVLFITTAVQSRFGVMQSPAYALGSPVSGALLYFAFASAIVDARKKGAVNWRNREYTVNKEQNFLH